MALVPAPLGDLLADGGPLRRRRWLAAAAGLGLATLGVGAVAIALAASAAPHHRTTDPGGAAAGASSTTQPAASSSPHATPSGKASKRAAHHRTARHPSPSPSASPRINPVQLTAAVDAFNVGHHGSLVQVVFTVSDTGTAGTGELTASVTLPAGGTLTAVHGATSSGGWTCQQASSGATCQHGPITAGGRVQGTLYLSVPSSACGEHVQVVVGSGTASATAQSPENIVCPGGA
jgi:hypothetical protein